MEILLACTETMTSRAAVTAMTTILSTNLAASLVGEEGGPYGYFIGGHAVGNCTDDAVVAVVKWPKGVVKGKGVMATYVG